MDKPIIFSAPMVNALLAGRKTMTRRLANKPVRSAGSCRPSKWQTVRPGDRLYVREVHAYPNDQVTIYRANWQEDAKTRGLDNIPATDAGIKWRPSIHLPRADSRLTLVVTAAKIEPLLDISEDDAIAEGFEGGPLNDGFGPRDIGGGWTIEGLGGYASAAGMFQILWTKLHPEWDGFSSPEVVALTFTVHKANIDRMKESA